MNLKLKKGLILLFSSVILFGSIFYVTKSLNNLINKSKEHNIASTKNTNSNKEAPNEHISKNNNAISIKNKITSTNNQNNKIKNYSDYTVKKGDTLFNIARENMSWEKEGIATKILKTANNLKNTEVLPVGTHLIIPNNTSNKTIANDKIHIIKKGENMYSIAKKYFPNTKTSTSIKLIMEKNNLNDANKVKTGLKIYIPNKLS